MMLNKLINNYYPAIAGAVMAVSCITNTNSSIPPSKLIVYKPVNQENTRTLQGIKQRVCQVSREALQEADREILFSCAGKDLSSDSCLLVRNNFQQVRSVYQINCLDQKLSGGGQ